MVRRVARPRALAGFAGWLLAAAVAAAAAPSLAPIRDAAKVAWSHAPYESGSCSLCHRSDDPAKPGPLNAEVNTICFGCHEDVQAALAKAPSSHAAAEDACTNCHNPHNASLAKLLLAPAPQLCNQCHDEIAKLANLGTVRHAAVSQGPACLNCHSPHAANVEHLLKALPYDLCVNCHSGKALQDDAGKRLTDFGELLAANPYPHGPVASKDCTACHQPHGGANFRLLVAIYPATFYAPFERTNYDLCFTCHNEQLALERETSTQTGFRNGNTNLHFIHVNKADRGRTCRACHEVHAAPQPHLIRNSVPYGNKNWLLPVNYRQDANGGSCEKTCHGPRAYDRKAPPAAAAK